MAVLIVVGFGVALFAPAIAAVLDSPPPPAMAPADSAAAAACRRHDDSVRANPDLAGALCG